MTDEQTPTYPSGYPANDVQAILGRLDELSETMWRDDLLALDPLDKITETSHRDDTFDLAEYAVLVNLLTDAAATLLERISNHNVLWQVRTERECAPDGRILQQVHTLQQLGDFEIRPCNEAGLLPDRVLVVGEPVIKTLIRS